MEMKTEALKLADELWENYLDNNECQHGYTLSSGCPNDNCQEQSLYDASSMIRRLVEENDRIIRDLIGASLYEHDYKTLIEKLKPLSDEEIEYYEHLIAKLFNCSVTQKVIGLDRVIRAIEERHGIK
jgi:hypothetical protein